MTDTDLLTLDTLLRVYGHHRPIYISTRRFWRVGELFAWEKKIATRRAWQSLSKGKVTS